METLGFGLFSFMQLEQSLNSPLHYMGHFTGMLQQTERIYLNVLAHIYASEAG